MMKNSFAAAAAATTLAVSTVAWAQSSVTVYGSVEAQVGRQTQDAPITKLYEVVGRGTNKSGYSLGIFHSF